GGAAGGDLRGTRRRAALGRVLPPDRARLRLVLTLPRTTRAAGRGAGRVGRGRDNGGCRGRLDSPVNFLEGGAQMGKWNWDRVAAGSGIAGVAGLLIATFRPGSPPSATGSRAEVVHTFVTHHRRALVVELIARPGLRALRWPV